MGEEGIWQVEGVTEKDRGQRTRNKAIITEFDHTVRKRVDRRATGGTKRRK